MSNYYSAAVAGTCKKDVGMGFNYVFYAIVTPAFFWMFFSDL